VFDLLSDVCDEAADVVIAIPRCWLPGVCEKSVYVGELLLGCGEVALRCLAPSTSCPSDEGSLIVFNLSRVACRLARSDDPFP